MSDIIYRIRYFLTHRFNPQEDKAEEAIIINSIKKNVDFRGANLWALIFAIFIASIGLNVNSTAVIIGATLISPIMGPVMGIGLCTTEQINFLEVKSQAIMRIKKAYDANNIMILFPIRTIDFGIKGGVPLTDMMKNS